MKFSRTGTALSVAAAVSAAATFLSGAAGAQAAAGPGPNTKMTVPQGSGAGVLSRGSVFGPTAAATPESVSFILRARQLGELEDRAQSGTGRPLSVGAFARRYGQPAAVVAALRAYLSSFGLTTTAYPDGLDVSATGTAGQFDQALSVQQRNYSVPAVPGRGGHPGLPAQRVHGTTQSPALPYRLSQYVLAVLGLTNYDGFTNDLAHPPAPVSPAKGPVAATHPGPVHTGNLTPADFARMYHLDSLYQRGATGQGQTVGIVTMAGLDPATPYYFWEQVLHLAVPAHKITLDPVDGGAGAPSEAAGSDESDADVEQSGAVAPQARIVVYTAPQTDNGFADAFFAAASQDRAGSVSSSWEYSETSVAASIAAGVKSPAYQQVFDEAYLEMAAQGQTAFSSAGDEGAYAAYRDVGSTNLSVGSPSDSPYVTAAGGTTLAGTAEISLPGGPTVAAQIPAERTWGWDYLWPLWQQIEPGSSEAAFAESFTEGGGGGYSQFEPAPSYQRGVGRYHAVQYLTPGEYQNFHGLSLPNDWAFTADPAVTSGFSAGRATPDLATDADPNTGYLLYDPLGSPALQTGGGGTSYVAPQLAGTAAVLNQYLGRRTGFWNPSLYRFAQGSRSPFRPLDTMGTANDNLYYTGTPGRIYNPGSGLGVPNLGTLAADFGRG